MKPTNRRPIQCQVDAVIYFFKKLDEEMINDLLFNSLTYQNFSKSVFIRKLGDLFYSFRQLGDSLLFGANEMHGIYDKTDVIAITFIGNHSKMFIEILFEIDHNGMILDIYEFEDPDSEHDVNHLGGRLFLDSFELDNDFLDYIP